MDDNHIRICGTAYSAISIDNELSARMSETPVVPAQDNASGVSGIGGFGGMQNDVSDCAFSLVNAAVQRVVLEDTGCHQVIPGILTGHPLLERA
jgi:hypothetical protein